MNLKSSLLVLLSATTLNAFANTTELFNSRPGVPVPALKAFLQGACWNLSAFTPASKPSEIIEGDGSLVSAPGLNAHIPSGIYSPLLTIQPGMKVQFSYRLLDNRPDNGSYIRVYLADQRNEQKQLLDSFAAGTHAGATLAYNRTFQQLPSGGFKLFINYSNRPNDPRLALDGLSTNANFYYPGGCNTAPVAQPDLVSIDPSGLSSRSITNNDNDPDQDQFQVYIESPSPDGSIVLNEDNSFRFTAKPGFAGSSTQFTYRICETAGGLCSEPATVKINLPRPPKSALQDFTGEYKQGGNIELHWVSSSSTPTLRYEVERSLDGNHWDLAGSVASGTTAGQTIEYVFNDHVHKNTANKKDILYRLKEVQDAGQSLTSKLLMVRVYNSEGVRMVAVTPNPARNDINVTLQLNRSAVTSMKIVSATGVEVFRQVIKTGGGLNNVLLEGTSKLQPGLYMLEVIINGKDRMILQLLKD